MAFSALIKPAVVSLALLFIALSGRPASLAASQSSGRLKVTVLDTLGRSVPNISMLIEGNGTKRTFSSNDDLSHEFELPGGVYRITSQKDGGYYFQFKRAPFRIVSGHTTLINVIPPLRILAIGTVVGEKDFVNLAPEPQYRSMAVPHSANPELNLLVQYDHMRDRGNAIEYTGHARPFSGAIVSYDALSICADWVTIDKGSLRVRAEGNVIIEDGKERVQAKHKVVEFINGIPVMLD
jgi:hypothetical protein